jgi:hypothetical protein
MDECPVFGNERDELVMMIFAFDARIMETFSQGATEWQKTISRAC